MALNFIYRQISQLDFSLPHTHTHRDNKENMLFSSKSKSRTVHHYHDERDKENKEDSGEASTSLTVWTKSLLYGCSGFSVIGSDGGLAYRVDNYSCRPDHTVLMDGSGNPIFTICRRKVYYFFSIGYEFIYKI